MTTKEPAKPGPKARKSRNNVSEETQKVSGNARKHPGNVKSEVIPEKRGQGRPSKYSTDLDEQARKLCLLGATDPELADFFGVHLDTIAEWKRVHESFSYALKSGKDQADANVADRLYQRAMGYEHPDIHITAYQGEITETPVTKVYAPDPTAAIFWLKNRQRARWRDRTEQEVTGIGGGPVQVATTLNVSGLSTQALAEIMAARDAAEPK